MANRGWRAARRSAAGVKSGKSTKRTKWEGVTHELVIFSPASCGFSFPRQNRNAPA